MKTLAIAGIALTFFSASSAEAQSLSFKASNSPCSKQRVSTPPALLDNIAFADGPHEVVCKLQEMGFKSATVDFEVNNRKEFEPKAATIGKRTYQEIVNSYWASAGKLAKSSNLEHVAYRDAYAFQGHALDYYIKSGPKNVFTGPVVPVIEAADVEWEGVKFYGRFQFNQEIEPFSFAINRVKRGDPVIIHPWMGKSVLETSFLNRISLSFARDDKEVTPAVATETKQVAPDLFRKLYSTYGDKVRFERSSDGADATLEENGVVYKVSYREKGRAFADLIVDIGRKPK